MSIFQICLTNKHKVRPWTDWDLIYLEILAEPSPEHETPPTTSGGGPGPVLRGPSGGGGVQDSEVFPGAGHLEVLQEFPGGGLGQV